MKYKKRTRSDDVFFKAIAIITFYLMLSISNITLVLPVFT